MGDISKHFSEHEFRCKCGCGGCIYDKDLINKLEKLSDMVGNKPIYITSGYRCPNHSVNVGGYRNDAHTKGIAVDCYVNGLTPYDIAECAEKVGFSGIGIMKNAVHLDVRNSKNYVNSHWFGNEVTGENNIKTFIREKKEPNSHTFKLRGMKITVTIE